MAFLTETRSTGLGIGAALMALPRALADRYSRRRAYLRTFNELSALNARDLQDIGLDRSMIGAVAFETAYGTRI